MGYPHDRVYFLDPDEATCPVRLYNPQRSIALFGSPDSFVRHLQRGSRTYISGSCIGVSVVVGQLSIHRGKLDRVVVAEPASRSGGLPAEESGLPAGHSPALFSSVFSCRGSIRPFPDFSDDFSRPAFLRAQRYYAAQSSLSLQGAIITVRMLV